MKPADVLIAVFVAVIWGLAFVASRIALNEFSPELVVGGIAVMLLAKRSPTASKTVLPKIA